MKLHSSLLLFFAVVAICGCTGSDSNQPAPVAHSSTTTQPGSTEKGGQPSSQPSDKKAGADADEPAPFSAELVAQGESVFKKKCALCHKRTDAEGKALGPSIETTLRTLPAELTDAAYSQRITALKTLNRKYYDAKKELIEPILAEKHVEKRLRLWLHTYLKDPKFDDPKNAMAPIPGFQSAQIKAAVAYILAQRK